MPAKKRRKEGKFGGGSQEFFTQYSIVKRMYGDFLFLYIVDYEE